jgi:hypothetical protein
MGASNDLRVILLSEIWPKKEKPAINYSYVAHPLLVMDFFPDEEYINDGAKGLRYSPKIDSLSSFRPSSYAAETANR